MPQGRSIFRPIVVLKPFGPSLLASQCSLELMRNIGSQCCLHMPFAKTCLLLPVLRPLSKIVCTTCVAHLLLAMPDALHLLCQLACVPVQGADGAAVVSQTLRPYTFP